MKKVFFGVISFAILCLTLQARPQYKSKSELTDDQYMGQRLFQQRCSVCHFPTARSTRSYAPRLYKDLMEDDEDVVRQTIMDGRPGQMPGWKYTLQPKQIDDIIAYLKTVERAAPAPKN